MRKSPSQIVKLILGAALAFAPLSAHAIVLLPPCTVDGNCGITDLLNVFVNFGELLLSITGAVALGFFIWGGFQMIISAGSAEKVKKGKDTLIRATIGIFIIMLSGVIVRFTSEALTGATGNVCIAVKGLKGVYTFDGGAAKEDGSNVCVPKVGDTCSNETITEEVDDPNAKKPGDKIKLTHPGAIWVSLPAGFSDENDPAGSFVPEGLFCLKKTAAVGVAGCQPLTEELKKRHRPAEELTYTCMSTSDPKASRCVRGICGGGADSACCIPKAPEVQ
jgi:hypothetical protein